MVYALVVTLSFVRMGQFSLCLLKRSMLWCLRPRTPLKIPGNQVYKFFMYATEGGNVQKFQELGSEYSGK